MTVLGNPVRVEAPHGPLVGTATDGAGPPALLVHSNAGTRQQWRLVQNELARRGRATLAFDLRGHGESARGPRGADGYAACADDLETIVFALGLRRVVLVGHSFGGAVVAELAARQPGLVEALLFVDAAGRVEVSEAEAEGFLAMCEPEAWPAFREAWFAPILAGAREETRAQVLAELARADRETVRDNVASLRGFDPRRAAAFTGPTHAVCAAQLVLPQTLAGQWPSLPRTVVEGVSHWVGLDAPAAVVGALDALVQQAPGT